VREATYVLDEILGNPTDLPIAEHAVDTHGQTFAAFAAFDLLGLHLSPRIRDLASLRLYRLGPPPSRPPTRTPARCSPGASRPS